MSQKKQPNTSFLKNQLTAFFQTEEFRKGVILHTLAVISSRSSHDWWSVDLRKAKIIHRATETVYPDYQFPRVLSLAMISEVELYELQNEAGLANLQVLQAANGEHPHGMGLEQLSSEAHEQLTLLADVLERCPTMLVEAKRLIRLQL